MAYATASDLLTGDIPLANRYGNGTGFINLAADEIDAQIGHIYVTPIELDPLDPRTVPTAKLLKKINTLLASGRIILDMAAGGEDDGLHAYGRSMLNEAISLLRQITDKKIELYGAELIPPAELEDNGRVSISNADPYSLVEGFYERYSSGSVIPPAPMRPYDKRV